MKTRLLTTPLVKTFASASILTASLMSSVAHADTDSFLVDGSNNPVMGGYGDCVEVKQGMNFASCGDAVVSVEAPNYDAASTQTQEVEYLKKISLVDDLNFKFDSSEITDGNKKILDDLIEELNRVSIREIELVGHTDSIGSNSYNMQLSERRANAVQEYLVANGIKATVISDYSMGETQPVATNQTPEGRAQNRRVDITIRGTSVVSR